MVGRTDNDGIKFGKPFGIYLLQFTYLRFNTGSLSYTFGNRFGNQSGVAIL